MDDWIEHPVKDVISKATQDKARNLETRDLSDPIGRPGGALRAGGPGHSRLPVPIPDGNQETIGTRSPAARGDSPQDGVKAVVSITADPETSERWRAELATGKLPQTSENDP